MKVKLLAAAAAACLVTAPPLAFSRDTPAAKVSAADTPAWTPTTVAITVGQSVTFESKGNAQPHYLEFKGPNQPACDNGVPTSYPPPSSWSGNCTFSAPGDYVFRCPVHDFPKYTKMWGTVHVDAAPVDAPTPGSTVTPGASPTPTPDPTPAGPGPTADTQAQPTKLTYKLAASQKGSHVRGAITAAQAGSRLEVTITHSGHRIGHWTKTAAKSGAQTFSVRVSARARSLTLRVTVALTPPGAKKLARTITVHLRR
jgi:plastocyanin